MIILRLQQLAVSAKAVDRRLETRIGVGLLLPPTMVKWGQKKNCKIAECRNKYQSESIQDS